MSAPVLVDCAELLAMPVTTRPEAEAFLDALYKAGLDHHFDDGAVECLHGNGLVTREDAVQIEARVEACYVAWEASGADLFHDCPIGHLLDLMNADPQHWSNANG